jgi:hypothetical protein
MPLPFGRDRCLVVHTGEVTLSSVLVGPRTGVRAALLRWVLVSLLLTGVIAMHVLSQHDAGSGHHGSIIDESAAVPVGQHSGHGAADLAGAAVPDMAGAAVTGTPMLTPVDPGPVGVSMANCILFLVIGAGALVLALLTAMRRRVASSVGHSNSAVTSVSRSPPRIGPPRISLCVLRV